MTNWEKLIAEYNDMRYFATDPVAVVKRCKEQRDIEVMGIVCSWLAYGNRNQIYKKCCMAYDLMSAKPYDYVMSGQWREYKDSDKNFYRLFFYRDFYDLMQSLYHVYQQHATLEEAVLHSQGFSMSQMDWNVSGRIVSNVGTAMRTRMLTPKPFLRAVPSPLPTSLCARMLHQARSPTRHAFCQRSE